MNRVVLTILEKGTNINSKHLQQLSQPSPFEIGYASQQFPVFPLTICMYLENPPFNKLSICFQKEYAPTKAILYASQDGAKYYKLLELVDLKERQDYVKIFEEKVECSYLRLVIHQPPKSKTNLCKQIRIRGLQLSLVSFLQTRYVCSLGMRLTYHPILFRMLEVLQYKAILLRNNQDSLYQKYEGRMGEILRLISEGKVDQLHPPKQFQEKWSVEIAMIEKQPLNTKDNVEYPDPKKLKKDIRLLQKEIRGAEVNNFGQIKAHISDYFQKYRNTIIKDSFLRYLSSTLTEDHQTALVTFWGEVKQLQAITPDIEEAVLMFFNFFFEHLETPLKTNAVKTLLLFSKISSTGQAPPGLETMYLRLLANSFQNLHQGEDEDLRTLSLRYCYVLFDKVSNHAFLQTLLEGAQKYSIEEQLLILQILEKTTFRRVMIEDRRQVVIFIRQLLLTNNLSLNEKNRAYNIAAYLSSIYGKEMILKDFEKLNAMLLMTMEKNIDGKIAKIKQHHQQKQDATESCEYCGKIDRTFSDQHLYDLHLAKECRYLTNCPHCHQIIQIPELFKHFMEQCERKHEFKHCQDCFEVIRIKEEEKHMKQCSKKLQSKCPLCYQKVEGKLKLKEHILAEGCPNNPR